MPNTAFINCFTSFKANVEHFQLPNKFTYPFCYQPHQLALTASHELQEKLTKLHPLETKLKGRMYGVLVVKNAIGELGYLSALSGNNNIEQLVDNIDSNFVPAIFELNEEEQYYQSRSAYINQLNQTIEKLTIEPELTRLQTLLAAQTEENMQAISNLQQQMRENKKARKEKRTWLTTATISAEEEKNVSIELSRQSVNDKKQLLTLKDKWQQALLVTRGQLNLLTDEIDVLKKERKKLSASLQKYLFKQYQLLNSQGKTRDLIDIFKETIHPRPPAGSGDCAAPKLLQYAFQHKLTPVCMAEFWWGTQPQSEIRKHQHYYPACQGKCQPILQHMLEGMTLDNNPLLINPAQHLDLPIVFQDEDVVVVNKPAGLLSVPGKNIEDSVYSRIKTLFPQATGSLIVHRLDMATSGLLILTLNERAHKSVQKQFINKEISKRYIAIIDGIPSQESGFIKLPLITDINDRPRQKVCYQHGKRAETKWQIIEVKENKTKLYLYPITGRTHQLRVHCAHAEGLNMPIIGDSLYGDSAKRLHLHAQQLSFSHPINKERLSFEVDCDF